MRISPRHRSAVVRSIWHGARLLALVAGLAGCHAESRPAGQSVDSLLRKALSREVERNSYWRPYARMAADSMMMRSQASRAVTGLVYHYGYFVPPNTADVGPFEAIIGAQGGSARAIATPADWAALAAERAPADGAAVVRACVEIIETTSDRPGRGTHTVYLDSAQLVREVPFWIPGPLPAQFSPPRTVVSARGDWTVTLWDVRDRRSVHADCTIRSSRDVPRVSIVARDSIPVGANPFL